MLVTFNFYLPNEDQKIICEKDSRQFQLLLERGYYYEYQLPDRIGGDPGGVNWLDEPADFTRLQAALTRSSED